RIRVPLDAFAGASERERLAALREMVLREVESYPEVLPAVRLRDDELARFRAQLGGDAELEHALARLLVYKEELPAFVDFRFLLRAEVYERVSRASSLTQAAIDDAAHHALGSWAGRYGYAGIRSITDRETADVFLESVSRGELQHDAFFKGQLFEVLSVPGY